MHRSAGTYCYNRFGICKYVYTNNACFHTSNYQDYSQEFDRLATFPSTLMGTPTSNEKGPHPRVHTSKGTGARLEVHNCCTRKGCMIPHNRSITHGLGDTEKKNPHA